MKCEDGNCEINIETGTVKRRLIAQGKGTKLCN